MNVANLCDNKTIRVETIKGSDGRVSVAILDRDWPLEEE